VSPPLLYVFQISHYCEKVRWALDQLHIDYTLKVVPPGAHRAMAARFGLSGSSVPFLVGADGVLQGSAVIIDWADGHATEIASLQPADERARGIEARLDDVAGVHVRRYFYSAALVDEPKPVKAMFADGLSLPHKLLHQATWPTVRKMMIRFMDIGHAQGIESRDVLDAELTWLDELLADGRAYLCDDRFTRVDITAASLWAPLVLPPKHPAYAGMPLPQRLQGDLERWHDRPAFSWVRDLYARHREAEHG
jgi:glutathione S-transferase